MDRVEILFPEQDDPNYFIITNEEMTDEILNYLNSLTLIREDLTEDEKIYNTYSMYIYLGDDTLSFGKKYLFCGKTDAVIALEPTIISTIPVCHSLNMVNPCMNSFKMFLKNMKIKMGFVLVDAMCINRKQCM